MAKFPRTRRSRQGKSSSPIKSTSPPLGDPYSFDQNRYAGKGSGGAGSSRTSRQSYSRASDSTSTQLGGPSNSRQPPAGDRLGDLNVLIRSPPATTQASVLGDPASAFSSLVLSGASGQTASGQDNYQTAYAVSGHKDCLELEIGHVKFPLSGPLRAHVWSFDPKSEKYFVLRKLDEQISQLNADLQRVSLPSELRKARRYETRHPQAADTQESSANQERHDPEIGGSQKGKARE